MIFIHSNLKIPSPERDLKHCFKKKRKRGLGRGLGISPNPSFLKRGT
jgi:hypothetical protein